MSRNLPAWMVRMAVSEDKITGSRQKFHEEMTEKVRAGILEVHKGLGEQVEKGLEETINNLTEIHKV